MVTIKDRIRFQVWEIALMDAERIRRVREIGGHSACVIQWRHLQWKNFGLNQNNEPVRLGIPLKEINSYRKFAKYIRHNFDIESRNPIYYAIKFYDQFKKNKNYSSDFVCTKPQCKYFKNLRCKTKWINHKMGDTCLRNRKIAPRNNRWHIYFIMKITKNGIHPDSYTYDVLNEMYDPISRKIYKYPNRMNRFYWFFEEGKYEAIK